MKLDSPDVIDLEEEGAEPDAMPGFHEHREDDLEDSRYEELPEDDALAPGPSAHSKPSSRVKPTSLQTNKPSSTKTPNPEPKIMGELECPICNKVWETDNEGLNSHVDFCLSRGAIWKAQGEATGTTARNINKNNRIPHSKGKRKG